MTQDNEPGLWLWLVRETLRLIAEQTAAAGTFDTIVLSMISMAPARTSSPTA